MNNMRTDRETVNRRRHPLNVRLALLSLAVGTALGLALAANWVIVEAEPRLRALLAERMATLDPLQAVIASPILEEVALRLFFMSALAWVTKYTLAGVPLGWVFWRWGLPYAILCHAAANATHLALQGRVF
jgi:hypothetical protein